MNTSSTTTCSTISWKYPKRKRVLEHDEETEIVSKEKQEEKVLVVDHRQPSTTVTTIQHHRFPQRRCDLWWWWWWWLLLWTSGSCRPRGLLWKRSKAMVSSLLLSLLLILFLLVTLLLYQQPKYNSTSTHHQRQLQSPSSSSNDDEYTTTTSTATSKDRVLYIVTSLSEYDTGRRSTTAGNDRYTHTLVPIIIESVQSMIASNEYSIIDVYVIAHYHLSNPRRDQLRNQLPTHVGLQIWDDATPLGYVEENSTSVVQYHTRGLARQHRYVMKDKLYHYDVFLHFEDDMLIHSQQIQHYIQMTNTIYQLRTQAAVATNNNGDDHDHHKNSKTNNNIDPTLQFYGHMTEGQLGRTIPGFVRVEVVVNDTNHHHYQQQESTSLSNYFHRHPTRHKSFDDNIPIDYIWNTTDIGSNTNNNNNHHHHHHHHHQKATTPPHHLVRTPIVVDASICCHVTNSTFQQRHAYENSNTNNNHTGDNINHLPLAPTANQLYFWEMNIEALGVRKMPTRTVDTATRGTAPDIAPDIIQDLDWVMLLGGNNNEFFIQYDPSYIIGDYWSGRGNHPEYYGTTSTNNNNNHQQQEHQRPDRKNGKYLSNQGGWIGTRRQIIEWHTQWCRGSFLPPYDPPIYRWDGLDGRSVEYWSGGIQLVGINACNLQRIVALKPEYFSRHLLYHASNNKQKSSNVQYRFSRRTINEFWGQINTVRKDAERTMNKGLENVNDF